jgi:hypothetical protein
MAISEYYADPSIAADSGAGTVGDPYGDVQYALNQITRNSSGGDRINIKAGTAELLSASLSLTTYGTPSFSAPLVFQGYTSVQGDGGQGAIDCNGNTVITNAGSAIAWYDMAMFDGPSTDAILLLPQYGQACQCEIYDSDGYGIRTVASRCIITNNNIYNVGGASYDAIFLDNIEGVAQYNYIKQGGARTMRAGIRNDNGTNSIIENIISVDSSSDGIVLVGSAFNGRVEGNTVLSSSGTGTGIEGSSASAANAASYLNNYVEGFSGAGGKGMDITATNRGPYIYGHNAAYNNTANFNWASDAGLDLGDNESLSNSGLAKSGADTFANRFTYFAPADEGNMQNGGYPQA